MKLSVVLSKIEKAYAEAKDNPNINKPISYSLYKVWRWANAYEKERGND